LAAEFVAAIRDLADPVVEAGVHLLLIGREG